jgi:hypothetical protein
VNPRFDRLQSESGLIMALNKDTDHVRVEPIEVLPGWVPERYKVSFQCRGITRIDHISQQPEFGEWHEVEINCDEQFPADVPRLRWLTPIWHPNIEHDEPKRVCVNKSEWLGGMGLDELCKQMFEMVQYKNYHAALTPPYPLDAKAAKWVREVGEPRGIVDKNLGIFVDDKPFYKATASPSVRLRLLSSKNNAPSGRHITIHRHDQTGPVIAREPMAAGTTQRCGSCGAFVAKGLETCSQCGASLIKSPLRIRLR